MKKILTPLFALISVFAFGQYYNGTEYRVVHKNDSAIISGVGQIRYDQNAGKLRFGNGTAWFAPLEKGPLLQDATQIYTDFERLSVVNVSGSSSVPYGIRGVYLEQGDFTATNSYHTVAAIDNGMVIYSQNNSAANILEFLLENRNDATPARITLDGVGSIAGMGYGSDISSTGISYFGDRWIPDKGYVDDVITTLVSTATISVSSAEILAINTTPKILVAAPGAGKFIQVISIMGSLDFVSAAYATNFQLEFRYNAASTSLTSAAWNIAQTEDKVFRFQLNSNTTGEANASIINQPVTLNESTGNPTTGDGTLKVYITYRIVDL